MKRKLLVVLFLSQFIPVVHAQDHPDTHRTKQIQRALLKAGEHITINGIWDYQTIEALRSIAKANNWQHGVVPDARVLQEIGLGARYPHLINPDTAWIRQGAARQRVEEAIATKIASLGHK